MGSSLVCSISEFWHLTSEKGNMLFGHVTAKPQCMLEYTDGSLCKVQVYVKRQKHSRKCRDYLYEKGECIYAWPK